MYIYLASSPAFRALCIAKLGCTRDPYGRRSTYLTGCPPGLSPSQDMDYDALWETTAQTQDELFELEDEAHNQFLKHRMMRARPGDTEWFRFQGANPCDAVSRWIDARPWVKRRVPLSEISASMPSSRYLRKQHHKNLSYLKNRTARNETLDVLQAPVVSAIAQFAADVGVRAGYVIAPCGSGKTIMTAKGIRAGAVRKCVICCPSRQIQQQWADTLVAEAVFSEPHIHLVGGAGTTDPGIIRALLGGDTFCILSTYASSHLLADIVDAAGLDMLVLDEAHHMVGVVASDTQGEGRTRRLMAEAVRLNIKRLSLTYTPRFITDDDGADAEYLTMDDDVAFGHKIAELKIRDLIRRGVLPDYRIWTLRDDANRGAGILGKAECLLEAWGATEVVRGNEQHILHHLVVFASTTQEAKDVERFLSTRTTDTLVLRVEEGDRLTEPLARYAAAPRAILVNCFVLNEGVDIPIANAVAITYPKQSRGQITQMVLRAGRWYEGKSVFHVLIPTLGEEDLSGFEEVLSALASCDDQIRDEIVFRTKPTAKCSDPLPCDSDTGEARPECIMIEAFDADQEQIRRCFANVRKHLFPAKESRRIQALCAERGVDTSVDYAFLRDEFPELPEDPRPKGVEWYDYLHPARTAQLTGAEFVKTVLDANKLRAGHRYDEWRGVQPTDVRARLPSVQHITDGFFGKDGEANFNTLREKYGTKAGGRGR